MTCFLFTGWRKDWHGALRRDESRKYQERCHQYPLKELLVPITTVPTLLHHSPFVCVHARVSLVSHLSPSFTVCGFFSCPGSELLSFLRWVTAKAAAKDRIINEATFFLGRDKNLSPL